MIDPTNKRISYDFAMAIHALKVGHRVARQGWNGKGMWIKLVTSEQYVIVANRNTSPIQVGVHNNADNLLPWIGMKTADGKFVPWLASQTDMLAEDWEILPA